jgi:hypothetical protein
MPRIFKKVKDLSDLKRNQSMPRIFISVDADG